MAKREYVRCHEGPYVREQLEDAIPCSRDYWADIPLRRQESQETIRRIMGCPTLTEREWWIVRMRLGVDGRSKTWREIAGEYGISPARARQIYEVALRKMRQRLLHDEQVEWMVVNA